MNTALQVADIGPAIAFVILQKYESTPTVNKRSSAGSGESMTVFIIKVSDGNFIAFSTYSFIFEYFSFEPG